MPPLISLNGNDIVKALFLDPMGDELRTSPIPEEETTLLGEEQELPEAPEATASLQECLETPEPKEPTKQIDTSSTPTPSSPTSKPHHHPSQRTKRFQ